MKKTVKWANAGKRTDNGGHTCADLRHADGCVWPGSTLRIGMLAGTQIAALLATLLAACGGESTATSTGNAGSGANAGMAGSGQGGAPGTGGGGAGAGGAGGTSGAGPCASDPLSPAEKGLVRDIVLRAIDDAHWLLEKTSATGSRGFGASVPATELSVHGDYPAAPPCTAATQFDPVCEWKVSGKNYKACTGLACEGVNQLTGSAWIEPLPVSVPTVMGCCEPTGTTVIQAFEHVFKFTETTANAVQVWWSGKTDLALDDMAIKRTSSGNAEVVGTQPVSAVIHEELTLIAPGTVKIELSGSPALNGTIVHEGVVLGTVLAGSVHWNDLCTP